MRERGVAAPLIVLFTLVFFSALVMVFYLGRVTKQDSSKLQPLTLSTPSPAPFVDVIDFVDDTFYVGLLNGREEVFATNTLLRSQRANHLSEYKNPVQISRKLYYPVQAVLAFIKDQSGRFYYTSANLTTDPLSSVDQNTVNYLFKIDSTTRQTDIVFSKKIDNEDLRYPKPARGGAYVSAVSEDNKYLIFDIYSCYACEGSAVASVAKNLDTQKEFVFDPLGNVTFDMGNKTFSYQKYQESQEDCPEGGFGCENGKRAISKPAGDILTSPLPD